MLNRIFSLAERHLFALAYCGIVSIGVIAYILNHRAVTSLCSELIGTQLYDVRLAETLFLRLASRFGAGQRQVGGAAVHTHPELAAGRIGGNLGHKAVCHQLAARDGNYTLYPVTRGVVKAHYARLMLRPEGRRQTQ